MRLWTRLTGFTRAVERRYPPIGGFVEVQGAPVHYLADGPLRALPVVLLHGASGNLRDWALSVMPRLARRHRVIALDRPGFGHSAPVPGAETLAAQVATLSAALDRLGVRRYCLVGHSYAGALALAWALAEPRAVAGVTLAGGVAMDWGGALDASYRIGGAPVIGRLLSHLVPLAVPTGRVEAALDEIFAPDEMPERYREEGGAELALRPHTFRINFRAVNTLHGQILRQMPRYGTISCPVEIVHGLADRIVPAGIHAEGLAGVLPGAGLTLLPGVGHMPHHAAPEAIEAAVGRMVDAAGAGQTAAGA